MSKPCWCLALCVKAKGFCCSLYFYSPSFYPPAKEDLHHHKYRSAVFPPHWASLVWVMSPALFWVSFKPVSQGQLLCFLAVSEMSTGLEALKICILHTEAQRESNQIIFLSSGRWSSCASCYQCLDFETWEEVQCDGYKYRSPLVSFEEIKSKENKLL